MNEVNSKKEITRVLLPDYVFSHLISAFRKLKPREGMAVLYGEYQGENVKAEKIWAPPMKYLETSPSGVKLTKMGKKYHSTVDHFEILSDTPPIAWVHSHPIEEPSEIDKTTQQIAQLFQVPVGIFLNYNKLDSPKKAIKAFKIGKNRKVEFLPIEILKTEMEKPSHSVKIEYPRFPTLQEKTERFQSSLDTSLTAFGDVISALPTALAKIAESNAKGHVLLSKELQRTKDDLNTVLEKKYTHVHEELAGVTQQLDSTRSDIKNELESIQTSVMQEVKVLSQAISTWKQEVKNTITEHHEATREVFTGLKKKIHEEERRREKDLDALQAILMEQLKTIITREENLQQHLLQKVESTAEMLKEDLNNLDAQLTEKMEQERTKVANDLKNGQEKIEKLLHGRNKQMARLDEELSKFQQESLQQIETLSTDVQSLKEKIETNSVLSTSMRETITNLEDQMQKLLKKQSQTSESLEALQQDLKTPDTDEMQGSTQETEETSGGKTSES